MGFELMRRSFGPIWKAFSHNTWSAQLLSLRFTFNENGFFKTVQRRGAAILKKVSFQSLHSFWSHLKSLVHKRNLATPPSLKVGTGPTLASKLTMDILAWSFMASLGLLATQPSVLVMKMVTLMMMMWCDFHTQLPHHPDGPPTWAALGPDQHLCAQLVPLERPHCRPSEVFIFFSLSFCLKCRLYFVLCRFYFDLSLTSSRDWRISHGLSHHVFTNMHLDIEVLQN